MTAQHLMALINCHIERDESQFLSIALQYAAREARSGKKENARRIQDLVQKARDASRLGSPYNGQTPVGMTRPREEIQEFVICSNPNLKLSQLVLSDSILQCLKRVLNQQENREVLRGTGLIPSSHILLFGPPGTGKTYTASAIAGELRIPLFHIRLDALFSRYFGETTKNLRNLFDHVAQIRGVYFFDEFDAIGTCRGITNDIGEIRRVLNSVLTFMEEPNATDSLVLAATNHIEILDEALARRFDEIIEYVQPDVTSARTILKQRLGKFGLTDKKYAEFDSLLEGLNQGEIVWAAESAIKEAVLSQKPKVSIQTIQDTLNYRQSVKLNFRRK